MEKKKAAKNGFHLVKISSSHPCCCQPNPKESLWGCSGSKLAAHNVWNRFKCPIGIMPCFL